MTSDVNSDDTLSTEAFTSVKLDENVKYEVNDLYGGAIQASVPKNWVNISEIRQVPDHQEVFHNMEFSLSSQSKNNKNNNRESKSDTESKPGQVLVFEILQYDEDVNDQNAPSFFFDDLADVNSSPSTEEGGRIICSQNVYPIKDSSPTGSESEKLSIESVLKELKSNLFSTHSGSVCTVVGKQLVVGVGYRDSHPRHSSKDLEQWVQVELCAIRLPWIGTDFIISLTSPIESNSSKNDTSEEEKDLSPVFRQILSSFRILDWSLFG